MAALVLLGFSSGLPLALTGQTLGAWLTRTGLDMKSVGLFGMVGLPYAFKFAWAPLLDRFAPPFLGRRRGWLVVTQVATALAVAAMGLRGPDAPLETLATLAVVAAFLSASQDIVADAYRSDVLPPEERGAGAAVFTTGYRVGMIASGGGALLLEGLGVPWRIVYVAAAAAMTVGVAGTLLAPEPTRAPAPPPTLRAAVAEPLRELLFRRGALVALAFVLLFKLPDEIAKQCVTPFLQRTGYEDAELGAVQGASVVATIAGALAGGALVARLGLRRSLWAFGLAHAAGNFGYFLLARTETSVSAMTAAVVAENFCIGLATAGFLAFLMSQCDARYSAFQFALLTSLMAGTRAAASAWGFVQESLGWPGLFVVAAVSGLPSLLLIPWLSFPDRPEEA
jgi:PAT family beta-lactamase induction signal transducer AmpG